MWMRDRGPVEGRVGAGQMTPVWRPWADFRGAAVHVRQRIGSERHLESGRVSRPRWANFRVACDPDIDLDVPKRAEAFEEPLESRLSKAGSATVALARPTYALTRIFYVGYMIRKEKLRSEE